jgi:pimeloyl-ACP methyl ester carboxylesterase
MLPAMSSISTRGEMRPLQELLAGDYETVAVDWPGFGGAARPAVAWHPDAYRAFLVWFIGKLKPPFATVAAGHAGGYCLGAAAQGTALGRLCLIAPTWRGPLPTVAGKRHKAFSAIARAGDLPVIGAALYRLNVNPFMVRRMALGHVYVDPGALPAPLLGEKLAVTRAKGARHAAIYRRRKTRERAHPSRLWRRHAATIESRDGGACGPPQCPHRARARRQARGA